MKREWVVRPNPETGVADRDEIVQSFLEAEVMLHRAGGTLQVVTMRLPVGDGSGEMVTQAVGFIWMDRTDGYRKPSPEVAAQPDPSPEELEEQLAAHEDLAPAQQRAMSSEERFLKEAEAGEDESAMEHVS